LRVRTLLLAIIMACGASYPALANCSAGRAPDYSDITSVYVRRNGIGSPHYRFEVSHNGVMFFSGRSRTPIVGNYDASDGARMFSKVVGTLRDWDFYSMRLHESPVLYIDGPFDTVAAMRCGVVTGVGTLGVAGLPFEADLHDGQTERFIKFVDALQNSIFAWPWSTERLEPTPSPSPSRHSN
jgi:hypothetical protein